MIGLVEYFQLWNIIQDLLGHHTVGDLRAPEFSHQDQHIGFSLMGRSPLSHGGTSGHLGPQPSVSCWQLKIDVGQLFAWPNEICRIRVFARCVIKQQKPFSTN
jgi:hypothetical protein